MLRVHAGIFSGYFQYKALFAKRKKEKDKKRYILVEH